MQALFKNKGLLFLAALLLIIMFGYRYFINLGSLENGDSALVIGEDLLKLSEELSRATLSQDLFGVPGYRYLTDFSAPVPNQIFGRTNPFDALGR